MTADGCVKRSCARHMRGSTWGKSPACVHSARLTAGKETQGRWAAGRAPCPLRVYSNAFMSGTPIMIHRSNDAVLPRAVELIQGLGRAHPNVEKHAKAREANDVDRRKQNVDCEDWLPTPFSQDAAAREDQTSHCVSYAGCSNCKVGAAHAWMGAECTTQMPCAVFSCYMNRGAGAGLHMGRMKSPWRLHGAVAAVLL
jgi:hypothetical protein